jgi:hypothetical protein
MVENEKAASARRASNQYLKWIRTKNMFTWQKRTSH